MRIAWPFLALIGCGAEVAPVGDAVFGAPRWAISLGGADTDRATAIGFAPDEDLYVAGWFSAPVDFGGGAVDPGGQGCYVTRRNRGDGSERWTLALPNYDCTITALAATADGGVVVTGEVGGDVDFGSLPLMIEEGVETLMFVASYDGGGELRWLHTFPPEALARGTSVVEGPGDWITVGGEYGGVIDLGDGPRPAVGSPDGFVLQLQFEDGSRTLYFRPFHAEGIAAVRSVAVAPNGDYAVSATIGGTLSLGTYVYEPVGDQSALVLRFGADDRPKWGAVLGPADPEGIAAAGPIAFAPNSRLVHAANPASDDAVPTLRMFSPFGGDRWSIDGDVLHPRAVATTPDGAILLGGQSDADSMFVTAYDGDGQQLDQFSYASHPDDPSDWIEALAASSAGAIAFSARYDGDLDLGGGAVASGIVVAVLDPR